MTLYYKLVRCYAVRMALTNSMVVIIDCKNGGICNVNTNKRI